MDYKEKLRLAKEALDSGSYDKETIEYIFPELKESEDERIRKWIRNELESKYIVDNIVNNVMADKALAWVEKQGEQNHVWSEEDEIGLADAMWAIEQARTIAKDENDMGNLWYAEKFLKSIKERVQPQSEKEWSGEDEEMYKEVLTDIIYVKNDLEAKECLGLSKRVMKAFNWFSKRYKSLTPQNTWKPRESDIHLLESIANGKSNPQDFQASLGGLIGQLKKLKE